MKSPDIYRFPHYSGTLPYKRKKTKGYLSPKIQTSVTEKGISITLLFTYLVLLVISLRE